ncbi:MAG: hypothetical protein ABIR96_00130 [Bdellovibrionota bacterium]
MADADDTSKKNPNLQSLAGALAGDLLKKAVQIGAGAYVSAEDRVSKTLETAQMPITLSKAVIKDLIDSLVDRYSIDIKATINFTPKKKDKDKGDTEK